MIFVCFFCNEKVNIQWLGIRNQIFWSPLKGQRLVRSLHRTYILTILNALFIFKHGHKLQEYILLLCNGLHIRHTFENPQEEACWFQLAVCCFTLWVLELIIPSKKRVWGALFCNPHCAINLYDSFVPSKHWLPHSTGTILTLRCSWDIPHLLGLSLIPVRQGRKWPKVKRDLMETLRTVSWHEKGMWNHNLGLSYYCCSVSCNWMLIKNFGVRVMD